MRSIIDQVRYRSTTRRPRLSSLQLPAALGGGLLAEYTNATTYFLHSDHLGSTRLMTSVIASIYDNMDYQPYGEQTAGATGTTHKFEGKERDAETTNDDFGARYYSSSLGRWMSADWSSVPSPVPYANLANPQTLNLYGMVGDNPESFADLDGHCGQVTMPGAPTGTQPCSNPGANTHADEGEGSENSGISAVYCSMASCTSAAEVSAQSTQIAAQEEAQRQNNGQGQHGLQNEKLKYKTVTGNQHSNSWEIKWSLTHNTRTGGWIVQHIVADFGRAGHYDYWEAWPVAPNSHTPSIQGVDANGNSYSDRFAGGAGSHIHASARFYEGLALPDSFTVHSQGFPAGILRATTRNPNLPTNNATVPNVRWWGIP